MIMVKATRKFGVKQMATLANLTAVAVDSLGPRGGPFLIVILQKYGYVPLAVRSCASSPSKFLLVVVSCGFLWLLCRASRSIFPLEIYHKFDAQLRALLRLCLPPALQDHGDCGGGGNFAEPLPIAQIRKLVIDLEAACV